MEFSDAFHLSISLVSDVSPKIAIVETQINETNVEIHEEDINTGEFAV